MKIVRRGENLRVSDFPELDAAHATEFQSAFDAAVSADVKTIDIDLSRTYFMDCGGVGALVALGKSLQRCPSGPSIRLYNPSPAVRRIFQLTRLGDLFPVSCDDDCPPTASRAE